MKYVKRAGELVFVETDKVNILVEVFGIYVTHF